MGSKEKFWLQNPKTNRRFLWKEAREGTGEDWSEKVAYEIARLLRVPSARVDLAKMGEAHGVLCWDLLHIQRRNSPRLVPGNDLLRDRDPDYPLNQTYRVPKHTVSAVFDALQQFGAPSCAPAVAHLMRDAFDAFIGYLMLDALIGNTDRHHENWGIIESKSDHTARRVLSPSYDHASSLGRELNDTQRVRRLMHPTGRESVQEYADKAKSAFGDGSPRGKRSPRAAFAEAAGLRPATGRLWLAHLRHTAIDQLQERVEQVPPRRLSDHGKRFTKELLSYNYQELLRLPI